MTGLLVLDVAVGLILTFAVYGLLATVLQELLATLFAFRAKMLERALCRMLQDTPLYEGRWQRLKAWWKPTGGRTTGKGLLDAFYAHPLVRFMGEREGKQPSYIASDTFARVLIEVLSSSKGTRSSDVASALTETLEGRSDTSVDPQTLSLLRAYWREAEADVTRYRRLLEQWFDQTQARCSGWYKKKTQYVLLGLGLLLAVVFNVDAVALVGTLSKDNELRRVVVQEAQAFAQVHPRPYREWNDAVRRYREDSLALYATEEVRSWDASDSALMAADRADVRYTASLMHRSRRLSLRAEGLVQKDLKKLNTVMGLGWKHGGVHGGVLGFASALLGWCISALAISLGAPFWFDLLNRFVRLRASLAPNSTSKTSPL
jgi:hypothetical protein